MRKELQLFGTTSLLKNVKKETLFQTKINLMGKSET